MRRERHAVVLELLADSADPFGVASGVGAEGVADVDEASLSITSTFQFPGFLPLPIGTRKPGKLGACGPFRVLSGNHSLVLAKGSRS
jgi:hypothetical protein